MPKKNPAPFKYRGRWRAQVTLQNGLRPIRDFDTFDEAKRHINKTLGIHDTDKDPELGGPTQATLSQAMALYAELYTISKGGAAAELNRINHYLAPAGMPLLRVLKIGDDQVGLETYTPKAQPQGWQEHNDERRERREETYKAIGVLACKPCSAITTAELRRLKTTMEKEGLSASSVQKEFALLRHLFNMAAKEWAWKGFENPAAGIKLGKSNIRFVKVSAAQRAAIWKAIAECDNPYIWPLIVIALATTMRKGSLLSMAWSRIDLENRVLQVPTKTGTKVLALPRGVVTVLESLPRDGSDRVFLLSSDAVRMAWDGIRKKAGVPDLQFRDLRHIGATDYARAGLSTVQIMKILGDKTPHMATVYINLANEDVLDAMDAAESRLPPGQLPPTTSGSAKETMKERRTMRILKGMSAPEAKAAPELEITSSPLPIVEATAADHADQLITDKDAALIARQADNASARLTTLVTASRPATNAHDDLMSTLSDPEPPRPMAPSNVLLFRPRPRAA
jgi:integrase